jgi:hypothetical protein
MGRIKSKFASSKPARLPLPRGSAWPPPSRHRPPMHRVREEHDASSGVPETRRTKHP